MAIITPAVIEAQAAAISAKETLDAAKAEYDKRIVRLAASVGDETGKHTTPLGSFTLSANNTYDKTVMLAGLSKGQFQRVSKRTLDNSLVKSLYPDLHAASQRQNGVKVSLG